jgi:hypothetical protein
MRFHTLLAKHRQNIDIQRIALKAIFAWNGDVFTLIKILETGNKKNKKLEALADKLIEENPKFFTNETSKLIYDVFKTENKFWKQIQEKWLITHSHSWIVLWSPVTGFLSKILIDLEWSTPEETQEKLFDSLLSFLWIWEKSLWKSGKKLLETLISSISITKKTEKPEDEMSQDDTKDKKSLNEDIDDEIDYSVWPYNYIPLWNTCRVWDTQWDSVAIEKNILENMSEKSLENFMTFSRLIKKLWLEFLLSKQHRLSQLATGVNFYQWEGMSESRTLKFLSNVWKNIWVPEEWSEDEDGNKKIGHFKTLWYARMKFWEIQSSQTLWGIDFKDAYKWNKSIVEIYMKEIWLLVEPFWELSIANWKK